MSRTKFALLTLLITLLALAGCSPSSSPAAAPSQQEAQPESTVPPAPEAPTPAQPQAASTQSPTTSSSATTALQDVTFDAFEYYFEGPDSIAAGATRITLENQGEMSHQFLLAKLDAGKTIDDVIAAIEAGEATPDWVNMYGGILAEAGAKSSYIVHLTPGNYVYFSFWSEEDSDPPDVARGMIAALTVIDGATATAGEMPEADLTITLQDFAFGLSGPVQAGEQLIQMDNQGQEPHHLIVFRLQEDATFDDFHHYFANEGPPSGPPPADIYGFLGEHSPGIEAYYTMNFAPGVYVLVCFLPSAAHEGAPHLALGMMQEVTVE